MSWLLSESDIEEIKKQAVAEYLLENSDILKNRWIPCNERLPDKEGKYLVTVKNLTGYWIMENNVFVCDYQYDDFIFQGWEDNKVIAWQPLPEPYKL